MIAEADRRTIERFKRLLFERGIPARDIVVFGSRARGDAGPDSDLDVLVLVDELDHSRRETISDCAWEAGLETGVFVQTVVMSREEAENSPQRSSLFMIGVREDGIRV